MLLNEPLPGHGSFWSSVAGKPYPIPIRVLSFEEKYTMIDPHYNKSAIATFAQALQGNFCSTRIRIGVNHQNLSGDE
jgi:hypothetical protein